MNQFDPHAELPGGFVNPFEGDDNEMTMNGGGEQIMSQDLFHDPQTYISMRSAESITSSLPNLPLIAGQKSVYMLKTDTDMTIAMMIDHLGQAMNGRLDRYTVPIQDCDTFFRQSVQMVHKELPWKDLRAVLVFGELGGTVVPIYGRYYGKLRSDKKMEGSSWQKFDAATYPVDSPVIWKAGIGIMLPS